MGVKRFRKIIELLVEAQKNIRYIEENDDIRKWNHRLHEHPLWYAKLIPKNEKEIEAVKNCIKFNEFRHYVNSKQALDASGNLYKFCIATINTPNFKNKNGKIIAHLFAAFFKTLSLLKYGIFPIWNKDGKPPDIKNDIINERRSSKDKAQKKISSCSSESEKIKLEKRIFTITSNQIEEVTHLFSLMGIPFIDSPTEADAQCAAFNRSKITYGVVTEDWDAIPFGCGIMLKNFSNKDLVMEIDCKKLITALGMKTQEHIIDFCSILGTDYCPGISGIKPFDAYVKFKQTKFNMDQFLSSIKKEPNYIIPENFRALWLKAKNYYMHATVIDPSKIDITWHKPKFEELKKYLIDEKGFDEDIISKINELELLFSYYEKEMTEKINGKIIIKEKNNLITLSKIKKILEKNNNIMDSYSDNSYSDNISFRSREKPVVNNRYKDFRNKYFKSDKYLNIIYSNIL